MKRNIALILSATVWAAMLFSCASTSRQGTGHGSEFFSGSFHVDSDGQARFIDCATRISMRLETGEEYEKLRRRHREESENPDSPVRIEFTGNVVYADGNPSSSVDPSNLSVKVDSLIALTPEGDCAADFLVPGIYRRGGEQTPRLLRLRPHYTYSIEEFDGEGTTVLSEGKWYRTSILTLEIEDALTLNTMSFQIIPERESLAGNGGGPAEVYVKEWL